MNYRLYVFTASGWDEIPVPNAITVSLNDVSAPNAGRTESGRMIKSRIGKAPRFDLAYENRKSDVVHTAIGLTESEYFTLMYPDNNNNGVYSVAEFYRGDVNMGIYNGELDIWSSVSFPLIARSVTAPRVAHAATITASHTYNVASTWGMTAPISADVLSEVGNTAISATVSGTSVSISGVGRGVVIIHGSNNIDAIISVDI